MTYLVLCPCGHTVERHDERAGCGGDRFPCGCRRPPWEALDAAIDDVRTRGWGEQRAAGGLDDPGGYPATA